MKPMTVADARHEGICRLCGGSAFPVGMTYNGGKEYAHTECLERERERVRERERRAFEERKAEYAAAVDKDIAHLQASVAAKVNVPLPASPALRGEGENREEHRDIWGNGLSARSVEVSPAHVGQPIAYCRICGSPAGYCLHHLKPGPSLPIVPDVKPEGRKVAGWEWLLDCLDGYENEYGQCAESIEARALITSALSLVAARGEGEGKKERGTIADAVKAIRAAGGDGWDKIDDPEAYLKEVTGE